MSQATSSTPLETLENRIFGFLLLATQIGLPFVYGYKLQYTATQTNQSEHFLVAMIALLVIGFGLMGVYVKRASVATLVHMLLIIAVTFQLFFIAGGVFERAGVPYKGWSSPRTVSRYIPITLTNGNNDRGQSSTRYQSSYVDCLACCISLLVAYGAVVGRISNLKTLLFAAAGVFAYEFNSQLFWKYFIRDAGFSLRVFGFGSAYGLMFSVFLGHFDQTKKHRDYSSDYLFQLFAFIGSIIAWALLPALSWADTFHQQGAGSTHDYKRIEAIAIRMWMALMASAMGSICGSLTLHRKLSIHDITFSLLAGGIIYGSTLDKNYGLSLPMAIGFACSFLACIGACKLKKLMNRCGVIDSNGITSLFFIPSFFAAVTSLQMRGTGLSIGIGLGAGLVLGMIVVFLRFRQPEDQFRSSISVGVDDDRKRN